MMCARGGCPLPDPSSPGGGAAGGGNILGFVMSMALLVGFCDIVDRLSAAMEISTWLSIPVALAVCGAAFYVSVLAVALPSIAHEHHSTSTSRRLCVALVIGTSGLTGIILAGLAAGFAVLLLFPE